MSRISVILALFLVTAVSVSAESQDFVAPSATSVDSVSLPNTRIVGGTYARDGQFPHHVSIRHAVYTVHFCAGSIIAKDNHLGRLHLRLQAEAAARRRRIVVRQHGRHQT